ncbi:MAG: DNA topoisomerase I [Thaumarchaeota archaeon]|nr:DNA topoisomerase I [Nitrososphaerota archaeon]
MSKTALQIKDYNLVICEKPDAARRVAEALGDGKPSRLNIGDVEVFVIQKNEGESYVICSALGHLYTVTDPWGAKTTYPVLDVEWAPVHLVDKKPQIGRRIRVIEDLAKSAKLFVHACDYDLEGETIGYNILKYACGGKVDALRAKFSTLTSEELREAFSTLKPGLGLRLAEAGRTRHVIDFIWGVNMSRALSESYYSSNRGYKMISIGRVQGPTLSYVIEREVEIRSHLPTPYWAVSALVEKDTHQLIANYEESKVLARVEAFRIKENCEGKIGLVTNIKTAVVKQLPPTPFNIGDLQHEAYKVFGLTPSQTLRIAEALYLEALISYPRTSSQKLPPSINYPKILHGVSRMEQYRSHASEIANGPLHPRQGFKDDPAHPAIYPTGELPKRPLESRENKIYDLIVRRFFAVFGEDALRERISAVITVSNYNFRVNGRRTLKEGWLKYYGNYAAVEDVILPPLKESDQVKVLSVDAAEKFEQPPPRFNQSSLLEKMENEGIGTKATRADIINTLYQRGYISGESMSATDIGFSVIEVMREYSPSIISTEMTRGVEKELEDIEAGSTSSGQVLEKTVEEILVSLERIKRSEIEIGTGMRSAVASTLQAQRLLGKCPVCKEGSLTILRSRKTGKRFVGCTNYKNGCRGSAPLPQKGNIRPTNKACTTCGWPIIYVRGLGRIPWRLCININCPSKEKKKSEVRTVSKRNNS